LRNSEFGQLEQLKESRLISIAETSDTLSYKLKLVGKSHQKLLD